MSASLEKSSLERARVLKTEDLETSKSKWISLSSITYLAPNGTERSYEMAQRRSQKSKDSTLPDSVGIVAILKRPAQPPTILLMKQFRPPLNNVCIEVPAGLIDANESAEEAAIRELKEETGYIGTVAEVSPLMYNDPGFTDTNTKMIHVDINLGDERNQKLETELEEGEFIECFEVEVKELWDECRRLEKEGYAIDARVCGLAEGIEISKRLFDFKN